MIAKVLNNSRHGCEQNKPRFLLPLQGGRSAKQQYAPTRRTVRAQHRSDREHAGRSSLIVGARRRIERLPLTFIGRRYMPDAQLRSTSQTKVLSTSGRFCGPLDLKLDFLLALFSFMLDVVDGVSGNRDPFAGNLDVEALALFQCVREAPKLLNELR